MRQMAKTKKYCGGYLLEHSTGRVIIEKAGSEWIVGELCTGDIFATTKTKKEAVDWVVGTFGLGEEK